MGITLIADIVPKNAGDFPMVEDTYLKGGYRVVETTGSRDTITTSRTTSGMVAHVTADGFDYRWDGGAWNQIILDIGSSTNLAATSPVLLTNDTISVGDAVANDSTKGIATFKADDFDSASGKIDLADTVIKHVFGDTGSAVGNAHNLIFIGSTGMTIEAAGSEITITGSFAGGGGGADVKASIDVGATADFVGAASSDGFLRTSSPITYSDGGNFVTLGVTDAVADGSTKGVASFTAVDFNSTTGNVELIDSVTKQIQTDTGSAVGQGHELVLLGGEGMDVTATGSVITIAGEDASTANKGIAVFDPNHFLVSSGQVSSQMDFGDLTDVTYPTHTLGDLVYSNGTNIIKLSAPTLGILSRLQWNNSTNTMSWASYTATATTNYDEYTSRIDASGGQTSTASYVTLTYGTSLADSGDITYSAGVFTIGTTGTYEVTFIASISDGAGTTGGIADFILQDDSSGSYVTIANARDQYLNNGAGNIVMKIIKSYSSGDMIRVQHKDIADPHTILGNSMTMNIRQVSKA